MKSHRKRIKASVTPLLLMMALKKTVCDVLVGKIQRSGRMVTIQLGDFFSNRSIAAKEY